MPLRPASLEAVEDQVEPERELDVVVAPAEDALVADRQGQLGDAWVARPVPAIRIAAASGEGSGSDLSSNRSWLNPKMRLPRTWSAWWASSIEKPPPSEGREDRLDVGQEDGAALGPLLEHPSRPRVAQHHPPGRHRLPADGGLPVVGRRGSLDLRDDHLDDAVEQVVLVPDVPVEGHRVDVELLAELAHAQRLDPAAIGEIDGRPEDALAGQGCAAFGGRCFLGHHSITHLDCPGEPPRGLDESTP